LLSLPGTAEAKEGTGILNLKRERKREGVWICDFFFNSIHEGDLRGKNQTRHTLFGEELSWGVGILENVHWGVSGGFGKIYQGF